MHPHVGQRRVGMLTLAVFCCASAVFLSLMSGHIYARDEETLYLMTDGIARHGAPLVSPEAWGIVDSSAPSTWGLRPTSYGPGQPLLALPLYWVGRACARIAGPDDASYVGRFFTLPFNAFVTAGTVALLFAFALVLGYRVRIGVALAVCYAATYAAIQARTFFAEPLTALLALLAFFLVYRGSHPGGATRRASLFVGSGFALGFALSVKIHAILFFPIVALYLIAAAAPSLRSLTELRTWRTIAVRGAGVLLGMLPPVVALLLYNNWLYGGPLTTGYGHASAYFTTPLLTGLYGLLVSSGKGIIWYAPPLLFSVIGLVPFLRRFPREGGAIIAATAINLLFYARVEDWSGDGAWGPRFLLIVLPWTLLPALPVLDRLVGPVRHRVQLLWRAGAAGIIVAGIVVQSLAIAVSFDVPILVSTSDHDRYFAPSQSPLVVSLRTARGRFATWWGDRHPPTDTMVLERGFYPVEGQGKAASFPRWTDGYAVVAVHPPKGAALHVKVTYFDHRPTAMRASRTPVTVALGRTPLTPMDDVSIAPANEGFIVAYDISAALRRSVGDHLTITSSIWNPATAGVSDREDDLGIFVNNLEIWADGTPVTVRKVVEIAPVPSTPRHVWLWANYPEYPHLLDWWPRLIHDARLPRGVAMLVVAAMVGSIVLLAIAGATCLWLERRRPRQGGRA